MKKFCIFCGQRPEDKNKEHVIPQWLIEKTGDPKRLARFGLNLHKDPPEIREFAFDAFTFPACSKCNTDFSEPETRAKSVVETMLANSALSQADVSVLLDWLDKVRVALWLGYFYLDRNYMGIFPKYHVASRLGQLDRTVGFIRVEGREQGITFIGPETPAFQGTPTCLALIINQWCLLSTSGISSVSRRLGLPYARPRHLRDQGSLEVTIEKGTGRMMRPVQRDLVLPNVTFLHQPIFRNGFASADAAKLLDTEQLRTQSVDWEKGIGPVFLEKDNSVRKYPEGKSLDWLPGQSWSLKRAYERIVRLVYHRLIRDLREGAKLSGKERRRRMREQIGVCVRVHEAILLNLRHTDTNR